MAVVRRLVQRRRQRRRTAPRHLHYALDQGQHKVQFGQCVVVLLLLKKKLETESKRELDLQSSD